MLEWLEQMPEISSLRSLIDGAKEIVTVCHVSPDGDAVGSSLAFQHIFEAMGKRVWVVTPDMPPRTLSFLPGFHSIVIGSQKPERAKELIERAGLVVCLDFNAVMRVDKLGDALARSTAPKALVDHHLFPEAFANITISRPQSSSTCLLLYNVVSAMGFGHHIGTKAAECLLTGMMTDTGGFSYNSNDPDLYVAVADMIRCGVDKDKIYKLVFDTSSECRLRLCSYAVCNKMKIFPEHRLALITLSQQELDDFHYTKGDTESLVNKPLSIPEVTWSVFMRQDEEKFVKVSCRSKGDFPVNKVCESLFGGGGHMNAAGGEFYGTLDDAVRLLTESLPQFDKYLN